MGIQHLPNLQQFKPCKMKNSTIISLLLGNNEISQKASELSIFPPKNKAEETRVCRFVRASFNGAFEVKNDLGVIHVIIPNRVEWRTLKRRKTEIESHLVGIKESLVLPI